MSINIDNKITQLESHEFCLLAYLGFDKFPMTTPGDYQSQIFSWETWLWFFILFFELNLVMIHSKLFVKENKQKGTRKLFLIWGSRTKNENVSQHENFLRNSRVSNSHDKKVNKRKLFPIWASTTETKMLENMKNFPETVQERKLNGQDSQSCKSGPLISYC